MDSCKMHLAVKRKITPIWCLFPYICTANVPLVSLLESTWKFKYMYWHPILGLGVQSAWSVFWILRKWLDSYLIWLGWCARIPIPQSGSKARPDTGVCGNISKSQKVVSISTSEGWNIHSITGLLSSHSRVYVSLLYVVLQRIAMSRILACQVLQFLAFMKLQVSPYVMVIWHTKTFHLTQRGTHSEVPCHPFKYLCHQLRTNQIWPFSDVPWITTAWCYPMNT